MTDAAPDNLGAISALGAATAAAVAALSGAILDGAARLQVEAPAMMDLLSIARGGTALETLPDAARRHAARNASDIEALLALRHQVEPLEIEVGRHVETLRGWSAAPPPADLIATATRDAVIASRLTLFQGLLGSLARCRLVADQLLGAQHLVHDQLTLARDVTMPLAAREERYRALSTSVQSVLALGDAMDSHCRALLDSGFAPQTRKRRRLLKWGGDV